MRTVIKGLLLLGMLCSFSEAIAAPDEKLGPKMINLKMGSKTIPFTHGKHQQLTKNQCWECHADKKGKMENWGEATAHKICIPCHDLYEKGPIECKGCHKKR